MRYLLLTIVALSPSATATCAILLVLLATFYFLAHVNTLLYLVHTKSLFWNFEVEYIVMFVLEH